MEERRPIPQRKVITAIDMSLEDVIKRNKDGAHRDRNKRNRTEFERPGSHEHARQRSNKRQRRERARHSSSPNSSSDSNSSYGISFEEERIEGIPPLVDPSSRQQIGTLWARDDLKERFLRIVNSRQMYGCPKSQRTFRRVMDSLVAANKNDREIYESLFEWYHRVHKKTEEHEGKSDEWSTTKRPQSRVNMVMQLVPRDIRVTTLLDIGCSEGSITSSLGMAFKLSKETIHGCDILDVPIEKRAGFTFCQLSDPDKLPYPDLSFEVVSAFMSLHHMRNPFAMLKEVERVLKPGGVFIVREHDVVDQGLSLILDAVHGFYSMVWSDPREMTDFESFFSCYRSRSCWTRIIEGVGGLEETPGSRMGEGGYSKGGYNNHLAYYHAAYQKMESGRGAKGKRGWERKRAS